MRIPLAEMVRRANPGMRRRKLPLREINPTAAQEQALASAYIAVLRVWQVGARDLILPAYQRTLDETAMARDSVPDIEVAIASVEQRALVAQLDFARIFAAWADGLNLWHLNQFIRGIKYISNVDLATMMDAGETRLTVQETLARNTALVRNVSDQVRGRISDSVFRGLQVRTPMREVAKEIAEATELGRKRSLRIASDQTVKLAASLDRERQLQIGITEFEWRHSGKVHFRPEHLARNGKVYAWDSEVGRTDPPGYAPFCGCKAKAYLDLDAQRPAGMLGAIAGPPQRLVPRFTRPRSTIAPAAPIVAPEPSRFAYEDFKPLKSIAAAEEWAQANVANAVGFTKGSKIDGINEILRATQEVSERFGLPRVRFMGDPLKDTVNWRRWKSTANAAYGMENDGYLFKVKGTDAAQLAAQKAIGQSDRFSAQELPIAQSVVASSRFIAPEVKKAMGRMKAFHWSANPKGTPTETAYHEMGHRLHAFNRAEVDAIFRGEYRSPTRAGWGFLVSKYSRTNDLEYVAETFSIYMQGDESQFWRIMPELLAFYKRKDLRNAKR